MSKPKVLVIGHARHGKDTVAEMLALDHGFTFASSSMFAAEHVVMPYIYGYTGIEYASVEECYEDRVNHRAMWFDAICEYNSHDASALAKAILEQHDIYVGMRSLREYWAARPLFDHCLWVSADSRGIQREPIDSMQLGFEPGEMLWVSNHGDLDTLRRTVGKIAEYLV